MLERIIEPLDRSASGRRVVALVVLLLLFWGAFWLVGQVIGRYATEVKTLDRQLDGYTPEEAYIILTKLEEEGRQIYLVTELTLDLAFPIVYMLLLSQGILYFRRKAGAGEGWRYLALLPVSMMIADYLENASVVSMLIVYPQQPGLLAQVGNAFTLTKYAFLGCSILALAVMLVALLWRQRKRSATQQVT